MLQSLVNKVFGIPLLYKVLLANALIVVMGATAGTLITARMVQDQNETASLMLIGAFALVGIMLSLAVNFLVLQAAFQPLGRLAELAEAIRSGDFSKRVRPSIFSDSQLARLASSFNETLDELGDDRDQLRELASQVIHAQEDERKRIARELHDDTAQLLFAQLLSLTALKTSDNQDTRAAAEHLEASTVQAIEGVRRLALELRPPALDDLGLREALGDLAQRYGDLGGIDVRYRWAGARGRLPRDLELVLYRIAQEAMTNVAKHSSAKAAAIILKRSEAEVVLEVSDDGRGLDPSATASRDTRGLGLGIFGMVERSSLVGGNVTVRNVTPHGVAVVATIPLARAQKMMTPGSHVRAGDVDDLRLIHADS